MRKKRRKGVGAPSLPFPEVVGVPDARPSAELPPPFCASFASFAAADAWAAWPGLGCSQGQARDRDDGWSQAGPHEGGQAEPVIGYTPGSAVKRAQSSRK